MVTQVLPDFTLPHKKYNRQPFKTESTTKRILKLQK